MTGLLLVDKPAGMTSHDVVDHLRKATGIRRIGHTGTLDPNATGLLVLCIDKATRLSEHLTGLDKVYEGVMRLGIVTRSYDLDGEVLEERPVPPLTLQQIQEACNKYVGAIEQLPPMVSAVKVGGERLYKLARKGETVERKPRNVTVYEFTALDYTAPDVTVRVACTSGTYVRGLCHDAGQDLGCGAALAALRRTKVGEYSLEDALPIDQFTTPESVEARLIPMDNALDLPAVTLRSTAMQALLRGNPLGPPELRAACPVDEGWVQIKSERGRLARPGHRRGHALRRDRQSQACLRRLIPPGNMKLR
jgi:tRNA pseudouridine55 synthase